LQLHKATLLSIEEEFKNEPFAIGEIRG